MKKTQYHTFVTIHEKNGHDAQKLKNVMFWQHHNSVTAISPELILGMAVIEW